MTFNLPMGLLRSVSNQLLTETCTITRRAAGTATGDGTPISPTTVGSNVPCAVMSRGARPTETDGARAGITSMSDWLIHLPAGTDVAERDQIVVGSRTFQVVGPAIGSTVEPTRVVSCVEIK